MIIIAWLRVKLFGHPDPEKPLIVKKIDSAVSKLNGATQKLTEATRAIENDRPKNKEKFSQMFDDALDKMYKEYRK